VNDNIGINSQLPFRVGEWSVDPTNNCVRLGDRVVNLEPKVMDVLVYLAQRQGQVVSREELEDKVWSGRIVSYDALTNSIVKLRKAFDSDKQNPIIKTIPKRGYSLVATVSPQQTNDSAVTSPANTTAALETATTTATDNSLLPTSPLEKSVLERAQSEHSNAERRQITVLWCELLNVVGLYDQLDAEDVHELLQQLQTVCNKVIKHYGGHIAQYSNGEMVIYFGYPEAHEGDAERAVRNALGLMTSVQQLARKNKSLQAHVSLRIGIHTGQVVISDVGSGNVEERMSVVGDSPTIAAALKQIAEPGSVIIGESTKCLVEKLFVFVLMPAVSEQLPAGHRCYRVQAMEHTPSRSETKLTETLAPLVGRDSEIELLLKRWQQSKNGESQVVMLCAEAGIGKSRILQALQERLQDEGHQHVLYFCSPYHTNSALYPVIVQLQRLLGIQRHTGVNQSLDNLELLLNSLGLIVAETAPIFAELLSLPINERYAGYSLPAQEVKKRTLECLVQLFRAISQRDPLLVILEDAHWADPTTRELMELLINELRDQPVLFVTSYRPEFDPAWSGYMHATLLRLNRLTRSEILGIIKNITGGRALPVEIQELIIARTDGVPLFVEELAKSVLASGALKDSDDGYQLVGQLQATNIPASLQDSLMASLDRLKIAKPVAQQAAVLGRSFSREILSAVAPYDEYFLDQALSELVDAELLFKRGVAPDVSYEFKHALVQDAAYQSLLKSTRQQFHHRIAEVLEQRFSQIIQSQPEVLAHHYTEALQRPEAIHYWLLAGKRASEHSANLEAIAHLNNGLELVEQISEGVERNELELQLLLTLGPALLSARGLGSSEAESAYLRARQLCREAEANEDLFTVTWGLWLLCQKRGRVREAQSFATELLQLANKLHNPEYDLQAHHASWTTNFRLSEFSSSQVHTQQGIQLYDVNLHRHHAMRFGGHDPGVCGHNHAAINNWLMGYPETAQKHALQAVQLANQINHPFSQVLAHAFAGFVTQCCKDPQTTLQHAQAILSKCQDIGIAPEINAQAQVLAAWVDTLSVNDKRADIVKGIANMEQAILAHRETGVRTHEPYLLTILADAYWRTHQVEPGLKTIDTALRSMGQTGERTFEAEVYRLKGELLLLQSKQSYEPALDCLNHAINLARQNQSRSLELRALTSLTRAQCKRQKSKPDIGQLESLLNTFSEGRKMPDQLAAAELIKELK